MASSSYIQLIDKIQAFCDAHLQIERFDAEFGEQRPNLATESEKYPYVFLAPNSGTPNYDLNTIDVTITCYDIIQKDRDNLNTIVSDCHQILTDLFGYYNQGLDSDIIALSATQTPVNNFDLDYVAGWAMDITFELEGWCNNAIPMTPITPGGSDCECDDANVRNSDDSYSSTVASGGTLNLPDSQLNFNGVDQGDVISVKTIDVDLEDGAGNPVTPDAVSLVGNNLTIDITVGGGANSLNVTKSGQTTSYGTGDDGDIQPGRDTSDSVLSWTNPFGNTNRFTDDTGAQTYTNTILIDWTTYDVANGTVLGWHTTQLASAQWQTARANANALTVATFNTGWRLAVIKEWFAIYRIGFSRVLNWPPFSNSSNNRFWTGSSAQGYTANPIFFINQHGFNQTSATTSYPSYAVREFTLAELGL